MLSYTLILYRDLDWATCLRLFLDAVTVLVMTWMFTSDSLRSRHIVWKTYNCCLLVYTVYQFVWWFFPTDEFDAKEHADIL